MNNTRRYETICVYKSDLTTEELTKVEDKVNKIFKNYKVENINKKDHGKRQLAYPIKRFKYGQYVEYHYDAPTDMVTELEKNLGYEEAILRYLTIKHTKRTPQNVQMEPDGFEFIE